MTFDLEEFKTQIRGLASNPLHRLIRDALREEQSLQQAEDHLHAAENQASTLFHESQGTDLQDGTCVWVVPPNAFMGFPPGSRVTHGGRLWENITAQSLVGEPGVDPGWMDTTPPEDTPAEVGKEVDHV